MNFDFFLNINFFDTNLCNVFSENNFNLHFNSYYLNNLKILESKFFNNKDIINNINNGYGEIYYRSSQIYNHYFFFNSVLKKNSSYPNDFILNNINKYFLSYDNFKKIFFNLNDINNPASFIWLCRNEYGELTLYKSFGAESLLRSGKTPIFCLDISEHCYYLDYKSDCEKYYNIFFNNINWEFVEKNLLL